MNLFLRELIKQLMWTCFYSGMGIGIVKGFCSFWNCNDDVFGKNRYLALRGFAEVLKEIEKIEIKKEKK